MSHLCDCEYCEYDEYYDEGVITQPEMPADYAEVMGSVTPHVVGKEQMREELDAYHAAGFRITHLDTPELHVAVPVPRRQPLRRRLEHRWYGLREQLAAHICPWDIWGER